MATARKKQRTARIHTQIIQWWCDPDSTWWSVSMFIYPKHPKTIHHLGGFTTLTCLPHLRTQAIEVLLKSKAFVLKRVGGDSEEDHAGVKGQYTWSKYGDVINCWDVVRKAARWPNVAWLYIAQWFGLVVDTLYMICNIYRSAGGSTLLEIRSAYVSQWKLFRIAQLEPIPDLNNLFNFFIWKAKGPTCTI